jgi:hypothetical protein
VTQIEQHRTLQQNAARARLPEFRGSELSLIVRFSSSCKLLKLNRQIPKFKPRVTSEKQTADTCSNRQKRARPVSKTTSFCSARDLDTSATRKMDLPPRENEAFLQSARTISTRFWSKSRSYRKQTTKPFLPGATTACTETAFRSIFRISAATPSNELRFHSEVPRTIFQSSNLSRSYGRS